MTFHQPQKVKKIAITAGNTAGSPGENDYLRKGLLEARYDADPDNYVVLSVMEGKETEVRWLCPGVGRAEHGSFELASL